MTYHRYTTHSKLFTSFVPICSQFRLYICYLGEFVKNETHRFQCFSVNDVIIIRVFCVLTPYEYDPNLAKSDSAQNSMPTSVCEEETFHKLAQFQYF